MTELTFTTTTEPDDDNTPPWLREDGHGPVEERRVSRHGLHPYPKNPGERVLYTDRHHYFVYDMRQAQIQALKEGWMDTTQPTDGLTRRQIAAQAVESDFQRLRAWANDQWRYVGVIVTATHTETGVQLATASLWGVEDDSPAYLEEVARELTIEATTQAKTVLEKLTHAQAA